MENVLDRYAEAHSVDGTSTNIAMLKALFIGVGDVFYRAIKDGNLPVCLQHAEAEFAQLITLLRDFSPTQLTTMTKDIEQLHTAAERRVKVKAVCKEPRDTTEH
jgi:hypothetical protein